MARQGESGGNMTRPSNLLSGHFTPSFPTPGTVVGVQASQALFQVQENQCDPSSTGIIHPHPHPRGTMPQAGVPNAMPLQHFSGTGIMAAVPPPPAAAAAPPVATNSYGATSQEGPMLLPPPSGWPGSWAPPPVPVQQQPGGGGGQTSLGWAPPPPARQHPGMPAAGFPAASGGSASAQAQPPQRLTTTTGKKTFEEFLLDAGVLDQPAVDKIFLDDLVEEMLGDEEDDDGKPASGPVVARDGRMVSLGDILLALGLEAGGSSSSSGPSTHQVRMPAQEALGSASGAGAGAMAGCSCEQAAAAAAEAREWRSRRMAKRKEAVARQHRPEKHEAPRGSQNSSGAI